MNVHFDFTDRHVVIFGGTTGINLGIAQAFAAAGARVSVASRKQDNVAAAVATLAFCVPAMWAAIHAAGLQGRDLASLRYTVSGGAPCPVVLIEALRSAGLVFTEGFGLTETAPIASVLDVADVLERAGSIGKPIAHVEYRIADEAGQDVPPGETGELLIRGPNVFIGYWQKPEATAEALRGGWFYSGDLARQDEAGYYYIVDRKKDMVISGGENVYPAEVEQVLYRHPGIAEVAVIGSPDARWGEAVTAVVVPKAGAQIDEAGLIAWCRERLVPRVPGALQVPARGAVHRRAAAHRHRQGAQARVAPALDGGRRCRAALAHASPAVRACLRSLRGCASAASGVLRRCKSSR
ncbi:hypothetical protein GCM10027019_02080 [Melaminivora jejuensis]|nr:AMP-binding protein [Melaminivora jejuensis]UHJ65857.1 AMP-binding protein [Melaminivora jejuensis]